MRLESWHGKLQLSKRRGVWNDAKQTRKAKQATKIQTTQNNTPGRWRRKTTKNEMNKTILIHVSNLSTKTGCNKKIIEFIQALIFFFAVSSGSATDSSPVFWASFHGRQIDILRFPKNGTVPQRWLLDFADDWGDGSVNSDLALSNAPKSWSHALLHILGAKRCKSQVSERNTSWQLPAFHICWFIWIHLWYIYLHSYHILHLSQSLVYALNTKSQNQAKSIFFLIFSHVHHHQTIKLLIKLWLITKSQKLHQCLSQASVLKDPRIGFWLASMEMFQLPFWGVKPSRQAAFLAPQLGGPQQTLLEFPVQILLSLSGLEKKVLNAEQSHTDTIYIYSVIIWSVSTALLWVIGPEIQYLSKNKWTHVDAIKNYIYVI